LASIFSPELRDTPPFHELPELDPEPLFVPLLEDELDELLDELLVPPDE